MTTKTFTFWEKGSEEELIKIIQAFYTTIFFPETEFDSIQAIVQADLEYNIKEPEKIKEMNISIIPIKNNKFLLPKPDQHSFYDETTKKILSYINKEIYVYGWKKKLTHQDIKLNKNFQIIIEKPNNHQIIDRKIFLKKYLSKYLSQKEIENLILKLKYDFQQIFHIKNL